jgi:hypothetical protein
LRTNPVNRLDCDASCDSRLDHDVENHQNGSQRLAEAFRVQVPLQGCHHSMKVTLDGTLVEGTGKRREGSPWELRDASYACGQACPVNKGKGQRPPSAEDQRHLRKQSLSAFRATFQRMDRGAEKQSISVVSLLDGAKVRHGVACSRSYPCTLDSAF